MVPKIKAIRNIVRRVLMGPPHMFTPEILRDELTSSPSLRIWGLWMQNDNAEDVQAFLARVHPGEDAEDILVARLPREAPGELKAPSDWESLLDFGSEQAGAIVAVSIFFDHARLLPLTYAQGL